MAIMMKKSQTFFISLTILVTLLLCLNVSADPNTTIKDSGATTSSNQNREIILERPNRPSREAVPKKILPKNQRPERPLRNLTPAEPPIEHFKDATEKDKLREDGNGS